MYSVLLAALIVALGSLPDPQQKTQTPQVAKGSIEGVVLKAGSGEPLKKAWVTLRKAEGESRSEGALTDAVGHFQFKDVEPGKYRLRIDRNGYVSQAYGARGPSEAGTILSVSPGQTIRNVEVRLIPGAVVAGHIYDDDGEPMMGVQVEILRNAYENGKRTLSPASVVATNDLGEYRAFGLFPGRYFISASFAGWARPPVAGSVASTGSGNAELEMSFAPTYYPGSNDLGRAATIDLRPGDEITGIDITLLATRAVKIRGRVVLTGSEQGLNRAIVLLLPRDAGARSFNISAQAQTDGRTGDFELRGVVPGSYILIAMVLGSDKPNMARVPLEVGSSDIDSLTMTPLPGIEITGRLQWEEADRTQDAGMSVRLVPRSSQIWFGGGMGGVKSDGRFTLTNVVDSDYRLQIEGAPEDCYIKSARLGGEDVLAEGFIVAGGKVSGALEITMSCSGGTVEGFVQNDQQQPATGAQIVLAPSPERRSLPHLFKSTTTDQSGRFAMKGIAPGDYKLFVWEEMDQGAYEDPDFLKRYEDSGKPITVSENSRQSVQLQLIRSEKDKP